MKDIPHIRGRFYIAAAVAEGEHEHQDFKYMISDVRKIARSVSAFANADGGRLLIGVKDNGTIAGVRNEEDIYMVEQAARRYCNPPQEVEFTAFRCEAGAVVIRATVARAACRPVRAQEPDGRWRAYYRVADENIVAHPLMLRAWQLEAAETPSALSLGEEATALLTLLKTAPEGRDEREIAFALGMSQRSADDLIVKLAAMGVVCFTHRHGRFVLSLPD